MAKQEYYVYSMLRGNLIERVWGYRAARQRAGSRFWFVNANRASIERHPVYGESVVLKSIAPKAIRLGEA